jgi:outer membrane immunogenic protein
MVMRKSLLVSLAALAAMPVTAASAADIATKAPLAAPPPYVAYGWTGFYVGIEAGGGWARSTATVVTTPGTSFPPGFQGTPVDYSGALGGFYGGYNYQFNQFLIGVDGDYTWAALNGTATDFGVAAPFDVSHHNDEINWVATVTGRVGYVFWDKWLVFAKGGWAWAGFSGSTTSTNPAGTINVSSTTSEETRDGWTVGGGFEYGFTEHWSVKLEGDYVKFNTANFNVTTRVLAGANGGLVGQFGRSATSDLAMFKGGLEYRF